MTHSSPEIKICGIRDISSLQTVIDCRVNFVGFVFHEGSCRNIGRDRGRWLVAQVPQGILTVAVVVDADNAFLDDLLAHVPVDILQLHGEESSERCAEIFRRYGKRLIKAFSNESVVGLEKKMRSYDDVCAWYIIDAPQQQDMHLRGGLGESHEWRHLSTLRSKKPWLLAGGLCYNNVSLALMQTKADGVDVSSGVEGRRGVKDNKKIINFIEKVRDSECVVN